MFCASRLLLALVHWGASLLNWQDDFLADVLFLCTGLRPVILMDYGGRMPQLQENLCSLLHHARQVIARFQCFEFSV